MISKERNDLVVVLIFSLIWIVRPISYDEMRSRHPIYPQEIVINISNQQQNASLNEILSKQNSTKLDEVILVKNDGILPGADAFTPPVPQRYGGRTTNAMGESSPGSNSAPSSGTGNLDGNCPPNPIPRFPHQLSSNSQNQNNKKKKKNSTQVSEERVIEAYQNFISEMNDKGYQANISEDRFLELSTNPQTGVFDEKSIFEAERGLQGEVEGLYSNLRRTNNPKVDLDFEATSLQTGQTIFVDHKAMIDFASLADKGIDTSGFPNHESVAFNMGKDSVFQKERFIGFNKGPESRDDVLHLYNFKNIRNNAEKPFLVQAVLNGAEQAGYTDGILFLNYE